VSAAVSNKSLRLFALSFFTMCALSACGGGDDGSQADATPSTATPAETGSLRVNVGSGAIAAGSYALDTTTADKAYAYTVDLHVGKIVVVAPATATSGMHMMFRYLDRDPSKYVIGVVTGTGSTREVYACRSSAWTAEEFGELVKHDDPEDANLSVCETAPALFDSAGRHIQVIGQALPRLGNAAQRIYVSTDFNWLPLAIAPTVTVEDRSTGLSIGTDEIYDGGGEGQTYGGLSVGVASVVTDRVSVSLSYPKDHPEKFIVAAQNLDNGATFACIGAGWTGAEREQLRVGFKLGTPLGACPDSVAFNTTTRQLTLNKASLPTLAEVADPIAAPLNLVLSLNRIWEVPSFVISTSTSTGVIDSGEMAATAPAAASALTTP
jgi:hypothetical protein